MRVSLAQCLGLLTVLVLLATGETFSSTAISRSDPNVPGARSRGALAAPVPLGASATMPNGISTVFLIVMENHDWSTIKGSSSAPYLNGLLTRPDAAYASNYHNVPPGSSLHPSEPNYLWLEGATNVYPDHTFTTDDAPSASN